MIGKDWSYQLLVRIRKWRVKVGSMSDDTYQLLVRIRKWGGGVKVGCMSNYS